MWQPASVSPGSAKVWVSSFLSPGSTPILNLDGTVTAREYAQFHVSSHTPHGVGLDAHNPGTHMDFSLCLGVY